MNDKDNKRKFLMLPLRAAKDNQLTDGALSVLVLICSYCDKDGITWVSQKTLAEDMDVSRQAITKQIMQLRKLGYVQTIKKGYRNVHSNTLQVIFEVHTNSQPIVSQLDVGDVDVDAKGKVMAMVNKAFNRPTLLHIVPTSRSESPTVKAMKEQIKMKQNRGS
jgi:biotin operon repressor